MRWDGFSSYRRRLPHWRLPGATYFVTWRLHRRQRSLEPFERTLVEAALRHFAGERYALSGYVVMNDHVHVLVRPASGYELQSILHSWKSFSARVLRLAGGRQGPIWQDESYDHTVRGEVAFRIKARYIRNNPVNRWPGLNRYPWVCVGGDS